MTANPTTPAATNDELIEKMAAAADPKLFGDTIPKWELNREAVREDMRKAIAVARPVIRREALEEAVAAMSSIPLECLQNFSWESVRKRDAKFIEAVRALIPRDDGVGDV